VFFALRLICGLAILVVFSATRLMLRQTVEQAQLAKCWLPPSQKNQNQNQNQTQKNQRPPLLQEGRPFFTHHPRGNRPAISKTSGNVLPMLGSTQKQRDTRIGDPGLGSGKTPAPSSMAWWLF
jgi:hypothetical protein